MTNSSPDLAAWQPVPLPRPGDLRGRYTTLEPLNAARHSAALWEAMQGHDGLWRWMPASPAPGAEAMIAELEAWQQAAQALVLAIVPARAIVPAGTGRAGGWAAFMRIEPAHGVIEVGNVMFSPALQRTRAATEAMYLMARHVFEDLGYRRYEWKCDADNAPSRRAALRLGFSFEGIFRQHRVVKGCNRDTAWFAMLDHEWPSRKQAFEAWLDPANFDGDGGQRQGLAALRERDDSTPAHSGPSATL